MDFIGVLCALSLTEQGRSGILRSLCDGADLAPAKHAFAMPCLAPNEESIRESKPGHLTLYLNPCDQQGHAKITASVLNHSLASVLSVNMIMNMITDKLIIAFILARKQSRPSTP